jgi:hypothetical protein
MQLEGQCKTQISGSDLLLFGGLERKHYNKEGRKYGHHLLFNLLAPEFF